MIPSLSSNQVNSDARVFPFFLQLVGHFNHFNSADRKSKTGEKIDLYEWKWRNSLIVRILRSIEKIFVCLLIELIFLKKIEGVVKIKSSFESFFFRDI